VSYRIFLILICWGFQTAGASDFLCAGFPSEKLTAVETRGAAKRAQDSPEGTHNALVLFAQFRSEDPGWTQIPEWSGALFDPDLPGSISHFYDTMSFGRFHLRGEAALRVYESTRSAAHYLADDSSESGNYGQFVLEILQQADQEINFSRFDGDADGFVDALFLVLSSTPSNFLRGNATGIAGLGLEDIRIADRSRLDDSAFITDDPGPDGSFICIPSHRGTVQQGSDFATTIGSICHEYGHLLGLPDLYDIRYLARKNAPPADDSAGIGAWGLMGWGALGWNGDDGPNSFCAWSRMQLGWAEVIEISRADEEIALPEVGARGQVYKIPVAADEFFLLEYRRTTSSFYDRHIPAEGLLVWHVGYEGDPLPQFTVDLECADGRWLDAGYPIGAESDSLAGVDNLDFWAHDRIYSTTRGGNLGDATDPFDGALYTTFTSETNPSSHSFDGSSSLRIEVIHLDDDVAWALVHTSPSQLEITSVIINDSNGDHLLVFGEESTIRFRLINKGGLTARDVRIRLSTDDPLIDILQADAELGDLEVGHLTDTPLGSTGFPRLRLAGEFSGRRDIPLTLGVYADGQLVEERPITITAISSFSLSGRITDEEGGVIANLEIYIYNANDGSQSYTLHTDADGTFQTDLPPGNYTLQIYPPEKRRLGNEFVSVRVRDDTHVDISLKPTFPVSGIVRDPEENPLSEVSVRSSLYGPVISDRDGAYSLFLSRGTHQLAADKASSRPLVPN